MLDLACLAYQFCETWCSGFQWCVSHTTLHIKLATVNLGFQLITVL